MEKLDLMDRKILYELDKNSRQSYKQIAKKIRSSAEVVRYRIRRLEKNNIIDYYMAIIDPEKLGYYHYESYFRFQNMDDEKEKEFIAFLKKQNNILWLSSCSGHYDLVFSIIAKDNLEFNEIIEKVTEKYGKYIFKKNIQATIQIPHFTRNYLTQKPFTKEIPYKSGRKKVEKIDDIDFKILKYIMNKGREPIIKIAKTLKESIDIVKYRLKNLEKKKIINTYRPLINKNKIGHQLNQILFKFKNLNKNLKIQFIEYSKEFDKIVYVLDTIGTYDLIIELEPKNSNELNQILKKIRNQFSEFILDYEIITITQEHQMNYFNIDKDDFFE